MEKHPSPYEVKNELNLHELAMDPILGTLVYLSNFVRERGEEEGLSRDLLIPLSNLDFFTKMLGENYNHNTYKNLKNFIRLYCEDDIKLSKKIALACLKELSGYSTQPAAPLETLTELILIEDNFSHLRRDAILGYPTVLDMKDFLKRNRFGFQVNKDLSLPMIKYKSPLSFGPSGTSFLKLIVDALEKNETDCFIYLTYLLKMMLENSNVFETIVQLPSPMPMYANFSDWFLPFALQHRAQKKIPADPVYDSYRSTLLYESDMKDRLIRFQQSYLDWLELNHPEATTDKYTIIPCRVEDIYSEGPIEEFRPLESKPIFPLSQSLIVGSIKSEELETEFIFYESGVDLLTLKVSQLSVLATRSVPTGTTNLALSKNFRKNKFIYTGMIPHTSKLYRFFDCDEEKMDSDVGDYADPMIQKEVPKVEAETDDGEFDLKYYRTNYILKLSISNTTNSVISFALKITPKENVDRSNLVQCLLPTKRVQCEYSRIQEELGSGLLHEERSLITFRRLFYFSSFQRTWGA